MRIADQSANKTYNMYRYLLKYTYLCPWGNRRQTRFQPNGTNVYLIVEGLRHFTHNNMLNANIPLFLLRKRTCGLVVGFIRLP